MQTLNDLIEARADDFSFLKKAALFTVEQANIIFNIMGIYEKNYFDLIENLEGVLLFGADVEGTLSTFFILKFADHWEANIGGMMEECEGELIDLFDETCEIFDIRQQ